MHIITDDDDACRAFSILCSILKVLGNIHDPFLAVDHKFARSITLHLCTIPLLR